MLRAYSLVLPTFLLCVPAARVAAQGFEFTPEVMLPATSVKDQARTGTCWSFATTSFLESEVMRTSKREIDLSEMFNVRHTYPRKAEHYVRMHGDAVFGQGSIAQDVLEVWRRYGAVPEGVYSGRCRGEESHDHRELEAMLRAVIDVVVEKNGSKVDPTWQKVIAGVLEAYLGAAPQTFVHDGKEYTPRSFADSLGLDPEDYVCLTSFTHHPFGREVPIDVPDNWAGHRAWNVPIDELLAVTRSAIEAGFTIAWDGDVSERGFRSSDGVAVLPAKSWDDRSARGRRSFAREPEPERVVTQESRQRDFDSQETTDDHLMHIVGLARDQDGKSYFATKNSSGPDRNEIGGYIYMSEAYVRAKTISILLHRDGVPQDTARRLGLLRAKR